MFKWGNDNDGSEIIFANVNSNDFFSNDPEHFNAYLTSIEFLKDVHNNFSIKVLSILNYILGIVLMIYYYLWPLLMLKSQGKSSSPTSPSSSSVQQQQQQQQQARKK